MSKLSDWLKEQATEMETLPEITGLVMLWNDGRGEALCCVRQEVPSIAAQDLLDAMGSLAKKVWPK